MIVGNCCSGCQRQQQQQSRSSKLPSPRRTAAVLSTSFRKPASRRVRFEAEGQGPSLPQRIHASAMGLARAALATPEIPSHALSSFHSLVGQSNSAKALPSFGGEQQQSAWSQVARTRPYWEQESCSSAYGDSGAAAFRSLPLTRRAAQESFDSFSAERTSLGEAGRMHAHSNWKAEFLHDEDGASCCSSDSSCSVDEQSASRVNIASSTSWSQNLRKTVQRILPDGDELFDDLGQSSAANASSSKSYDTSLRPMDARTIKRLKMILQHFAQPAPSTAVLSVR